MSSVPESLVKPLADLKEIRKKMRDIFRKRSKAKDFSKMLSATNQVLNLEKDLKASLSPEQVIQVREFGKATQNRIKELEDEVETERYNLSLVQGLCQHEDDDGDCIYCGARLSDD